MTALLLVIGCLGIPRDNKQALSAVVALMAIWGFLVRHTDGEIFSASAPTNVFTVPTYSRSGGLCCRW